MSKRSWTDEQLIAVVKESRSIRMVIQKLGLIPAGGNYAQVSYAIKNLELDTSHFKGMGWSRGLNRFPSSMKIPLKEILVKESYYQSFKLRNRLFADGLKNRCCELCGWAEMSVDGRIPLELDHINGMHTDNRIANLRILCPNCHSLQPTHRGKNKKTRS
jgi:hypothetical protein